MHEFELGVWKTLLTHLLRVLYAASGPSGALVDALNERYQYTFSRWHMTNLKQVQASADIRPNHNPKFPGQCLRNEEACGPGLRRFVAGVAGISRIYWRTVLTPGCTVRDPCVRWPPR